MPIILLEKIHEMADIGERKIKEKQKETQAEKWQYFERYHGVDIPDVLKPYITKHIGGVEGTNNYLVVDIPGFDIFNIFAKGKSIYYKTYGYTETDLDIILARCRIHERHSGIIKCSVPTHKMVDLR